MSPKQSGFGFDDFLKAMGAEPKKTKRVGFVDLETAQELAANKDEAEGLTAKMAKIIEDEAARLAAQFQEFAMEVKAQHEPLILEKQHCVSMLWEGIYDSLNVPDDDRDNYTFNIDKTTGLVTVEVPASEAKMPWPPKKK